MIRTKGKAQDTQEPQGGEDVYLFDVQKYDKMIERADELTNTANGLLNLFADHDMKIDPGEVLKLTRTPGKVRDAIIEHEAGEVGRAGGMVRTRIVEMLSERLNVARIPSCHVSDDVFKYVSYNDALQMFSSDYEAMKKDSNVKLQPTEAATWRKLQAATDLLNDVFGGDPPIAWWTIWSRAGNYGTCGKLVLSQDLPFTYAFKSWAGTFSRDDEAKKAAKD